MKAKLYINSEESTIKAEGHYNVVLTFLAEAIAKILRGYFPHDLEKQMAFLSGLFYGTVRELNKEDDDED